MPSDKRLLGTPEEWLRYAKNDLLLARYRPASGILLESLCFHIQQAIEKSLKAFLVYRKIPFPYTHDIAKLITLINESGVSFPQELYQAADLSDYAVLGRYPGPLGETNEEEYLDAIKIAEQVITWVENYINTLSE